MDGIPELGGREARRLVRRTVANACSFHPREPEHALGEVPVRAALEQGERAVREPVHVVQRRRVDLGELRQLDADSELAGRKVGEQRQLALDRSFLGLGRRLARNVRDDGEHEARVVALDLERMPVRRRHELVSLETLEHPADRRLAVGPALGVDRPGHDQPIDRARHGDVVETEPLRAFLPLLGRSHVLESEDRLPVAASRVNHAEAEPAVRERHDLVGAAGPARVAPGVRHDDDLELETLCAVDGEQTHRPRALLLRDRFELPRAERLLLADEPARTPRDRRPESPRTREPAGRACVGSRSAATRPSARAPRGRSRAR